MLRGIISRAIGGGRRPTGTGGAVRGTTRPGTTGGSTGEMERGARTLFRGFMRRRRGL